MSDEEYYSEVELSDVSSLNSSDDNLELLLLDQSSFNNQNYLDVIVPQYSEEVFFEHFRVSRLTANYISNRFEGSQYFNMKVGQYGHIPALDQTLIFLWYMGHQTARFRDVADRFDVTISSINRIIYRLTMFLSNLSPEIIKWPNENEKRISEDHFQTNGFPNVIGVIDGTHIKLDKPENDPDTYLNQKGYYSVQMQAVCDHRRKIIDIFVGYPGSVHASNVFRNSPLKNNLEAKCGRYFLLGDSSYPLLVNLLTPYKDKSNNLTRRQQNYNLKLLKNRCVIEHCLELLKQKFPQIRHIKLRKIRLICHFIRAACVLHNIALDDHFAVNNEAVEVDENNKPDYKQHVYDEDIENVEACALRNRVANNLPM